MLYILVLFIIITLVKTYDFFFSALEVVLDNLIRKANEVVETTICIQKKQIDAVRKHTALLKQAMEDVSEVWM